MWRLDVGECGLDTAWSGTRAQHMPHSIRRSSELSHPAENVHPAIRVGFGLHADRRLDRRDVVVARTRELHPLHHVADARGRFLVGLVDAAEWMYLHLHRGAE